jgi:hypothetical protein
MNEIDKAAAALKGLEMDADWQNAMGVIALRKGQLEAANNYFKKAGTQTATKNLAVLDILNGKYEDAAAKLAGSTECNAALAQILVGNYAAADQMTCKCAKSYYVRAIAAARQGNAEGVKANLEKACKNEKLAERAAKDVEFAQYR